jgi:hypothetical protein
MVGRVDISSQKPQTVVGFSRVEQLRHVSFILHAYDLQSDIRLVR